MTQNPASYSGALSYGRGSDVVPLYHRVYVILLQKLTDGSYPVGQALPSRLEHEGRVVR
ncbi:MAG: hypothetical protein NTZ22_07940 [Hyphomicrobiales bacterium]|nr:hypothetical protein [Hyphomicrobiales bacterium]